MNTMATRNRTRRQRMVHKTTTVHSKLKVEQHESRQTCGDGDRGC